MSKQKNDELPTMTIIPKRTERIYYGTAIYNLHAGEPITVLKELAEPLIRDGYATKAV